MDPLVAAARLESAAVARQIEALPQPIQPASGNASQARDSLTSFAAPFLLGADNLVTSNNGSVLTLRLNPIRSAKYGSLGVSVSVQEAAVGKGILNQVDEARRATLQGILDDRFDDFDDFTVEAQYALERPLPKNPDDLLDPDRGSRQLIFGRSHKRYKLFLENALIPRLLDARREQFAETAAELGDCDEWADRWAVAQNVPSEGSRDLTFRQLEIALKERYESCVRAWTEEVGWLDREDLWGDKLALLPFLIDNQPQLSGTYTWNRRDEWVGQEEHQAEVSLELGFQNLNTLIDKIRNGTDPWKALDSFKEGLTKSENRLTLSAKWTEREELTLDETFGEDDPFTIALGLPDSEEWCGKAQYSRLATWNPFKIQSETAYPRLHISAEYFDVSGDDAVRQDKRIVTKVTYEIPITAASTVPISLTYANKAEFLGDQDEQLTAHFGLSYSLPWGKEGDED